MITKADISKFLDDPELTVNANKDDLLRLIEIYPFCEQLYWIYLRVLFIQNDATFDDELQKYGLRLSNKKQFYDYMTFSSEELKKNRNLQSDNLIAIAPVNYFEVQKNPEQQYSLEKLAAKLKQARLERQKNMSVSPKIVENIEKDNLFSDEKYTKKVIPEPEISQVFVEKLIKDGEYSRALEILRSINLNNPKKSVYFALQIKYLETIINNNNKLI